MMQNLQQIAQLMKGRNAQEAALQMIKNSNINDPRISALIQYAQNGDEQSLMNLASQIFSQYGLDLNTELSSFFQMLK